VKTGRDGAAGPPGVRWADGVPNLGSLFIVYVHEMPADLAALQDLLDRSYATAGWYLLRIITAQ
jgi:hypothetical protein